MSTIRLTPPERRLLVGILAGIALFLYAFAFFTGILKAALILTTVAVVLVAVLGLMMWLGRQFITGARWTRPMALPLSAPPSHWAGILDRTFPLSRSLAPALQDRLLRMVQLFVGEKRFEGGAGFEITEEIKVTIAAQACYLLLRLDAGCYPGLRTIVVYPRTYGDNAGIQAHLAMLMGEAPAPPGERLGESWDHGTVVVSWDASLHGALNAADGHNVVFHEFAHQLDQEDGVADGVPSAFLGGAIRTWAGVIAKHHELLSRATLASRRTVLDKYGATNPAEFFAVATEAFFEKPRQLKKHAPDLYAELAAFYGTDPTAPTTAPTSPAEAGTPV